MLYKFKLQYLFYVFLIPVWNILGELCISLARHLMYFKYISTVHRKINFRSCINCKVS